MNKLLGNYMLNQKYVVSNDFIDLNGHLSEVGYYYYAVQTVWAINKQLGLIEKYKENNIGPIIFDTKIKFKKNEKEIQAVAMLVDDNK